MDNVNYFRDRMLAAGFDIKTNSERDLCCDAL